MVGMRNDDRLNVAKMPSLPGRLDPPGRHGTQWRAVMKFVWLVIAIAALALAAADTASARAKHHRHRAYRAHCSDQAVRFSWDSLLPGGGRAPAPNGCAPPVYQYGRFVGQDPDPNIRFQLRRDPATGYTSDLQF
jgi:hypothetical protein